MSNSDYSDLDAEIIDITPKRKSVRGQSKWLILAAIFFLLVVLLSGASNYTEELWFDSLGIASRF